jgi:hypothetical protein
MGKLMRGALWVAFPPAGAVASVRAGQRQRTEKIVDAIERAGGIRPTPATPQIQHGPYGWRGELIQPGDTLTPNGCIRRNGAVILPKKSLELFRAWREAGNIKGLTISEISRRVGEPDPGEWKPGPNGSESRSWSRPGYYVTVQFDREGRALSLTEQLG